MKRTNNKKSTSSNYTSKWHTKHTLQSESDVVRCWNRQKTFVRKHTKKWSFFDLFVLNNGEPWRTLMLRLSFTHIYTHTCALDEKTRSIACDFLSSPSFSLPLCSGNVFLLLCRLSISCENVNFTKGHIEIHFKPKWSVECVIQAFFLLLMLLLLFVIHIELYATLWTANFDKIYVGFYSSGFFGFNSLYTHIHIAKLWVVSALTVYIVQLLDACL